MKIGQWKETGRETGHGRLEKYLPTNYGASERAWKMGGGGEATAVEKGGRMSATQAENKQTTVQARAFNGGWRHAFLFWLGGS